MKLIRYFFSAGYVVSLLTSVPIVQAQSGSTDILITELQVRSSAATGAADQEFVMLYNTTEQPVDMSKWKLQYKSATGISWTDKATLHGNLAAHGHYLLVSDKYPNPPSSQPGDPALALDTFSAGLADGAGHVRITDFNIPAVPVVHDLLGWGATANAAEGNAPALAPTGGKSLKRKVTLENIFTDTDNNAADFEINNTPTPQADPLYIAQVTSPDPDTDPVPEPEPISSPPQDPEPSSAEPEITPPSSDPPSTNAEEPEPAPVLPLLPPQITELLPNPAAPGSDSTDEFIEIYNPNDQPLDLQNYKLQSGNTFSYSYKYDAITLNAHEYRAFLVSQTGDILSNTSGQARLVGPAGLVVAQTNPYESAPDGQAWAFINGAWQWTTTPTPNSSNILTAEAQKSIGVVKVPATPKQASSSKSSAKPAASLKPPANAKTTTAKATKSTAIAPERQVYEDPAISPPALHPGILAGVGLITLLYAGYEYRYDAINTLRRFRRYREIRRTARAQAAGR